MSAHPSRPRTARGADEKPKAKVYSNGVAAERPPLGGVRTIVASCPLVSLGRNGNGSWTLILDADYRFVLADGRELRFAGQLRLKGRQYGRKPREAPPS